MTPEPWDLFGLRSRRDSWLVGRVNCGGDGYEMQRLRINPHIRRREFPWLIQISVPHEEWMEEGSSEYERIQNIEREMDRLESLLGFVTVGVLMKSSSRIWIIYAQTETVASAGWFEKSDSKSVELESRPDPKWIRHQALVKGAKRGRTTYILDY